MSKVEQYANEAVFALQFNSRDAVRYIQRHAGVDEKTAGTALKQVIVFHKTAKCQRGSV